MRKRQSAEARQSQIVEAALRLSAELGPERLSTSAIAKEVGLTQPGLFRHFPTKQALWAAVAERIASLMQKNWSAASEGSASPTDKIQTLVHRQLRLIKTTPAIPAILFSRELHSTNSGLRLAFFKLMTRFHQLFADLFAEARKAGDAPDALDPNDAAYLVIALVQGLAVRWSLSGRSFDLVAEGERLLALQLRALGVGDNDRKARELEQ